MKKKIFHITSEVAPFYKRGGLGDVLGALPKYLTNENYDNIVFSPYYLGKMNIEDESCVKTNHVMEIFGIDYEFYCYAIRSEGVDYCFLNLSDEEIYASLETSNDGEQPYKGGSSFMYYLYFAQSILSFIRDLDILPTQLICHDWQSAGVFAYPDQLDLIRNRCDFVSTYIIHNYDFQGDILRSALDYLPSEAKKAIEPLFAQYNSATMLALGVKNADYVATVSPNYARELLRGELPHKGLRYLSDTDSIIPFMNGVDDDIWHPETSPYLEENFDFNSLNRKRKIKEKIINGLGLDPKNRQSSPLVLMMSRLTSQKGIQLLIGGSESEMIQNMQGIFDLGLCLIIHGSPASGFCGHTHRRLSLLQEQFPGRLHYDPHYEEQKAHEYLAAADMILIPSLFEPCGLVQIYAMAFGTVPIVRPVGGLRDTVIFHQAKPLKGTGFYMENFTIESLIDSLRLASTTCEYDQENWRSMVQRCMNKNFSWDVMKDQYLDFFQLTESKYSFDMKHQESQLASLDHVRN